MIGMIAILFLFAIAFKLAGDKKSKNLAYLTGATLIGFLLYLLLKVPTDLDYIKSFTPWIKSLGIHLDFALDGPSLLFAILVSFIGSGVFVYAAEYMEGKKGISSLFSALSIFTAAMLGLVFSQNLIVLFLFWEMTSITSYLLIAFKSHDRSARDSAKTALFVTFSGGLFLLVGIILLGLKAQSLGLDKNQLYSLAALSQLDFSQGPQTLVSLSLLCFFIAIGTKSAQFPFHFWLPYAMAGPTPVSSFLHSATMVKAGIFLLFRLLPIYGDHPLWSLLIPLGGVTMIFAAVMAITRSDIKKILAYTTISVLGIIVLLIGLNTEYSIKAAIVFTVAHALYKAAFFQIIGNVDYSLKNREIFQLSGLKKIMPITSVAVLLSALSMAGVPPFFGFFGKELLYFSKLDLNSLKLILTAMGLMTNIILTGLAFSICFRVFWNRPKESSYQIGQPQKLPLAMQLVPLLYSVTGLIIGIFPVLFYEDLGSKALSAILVDNVSMKLKLWHGLELDSLFVLGLSILTLAIGYIFMRFFRSLHLKLEWLYGKSPPFKGMMDFALTKILLFAKKITRSIHHGSLIGYLRLYFVSITLILFLTFLPLSSTIQIPSINFIEFPLGLLLSIPLLLILKLTGKLSQMMLLSFGGIGLIFTFALYSGVDLALTQLMVESLSIFFLFFLLTRSINFEKAKQNSLIDVIIALTFSITLMLYILIPPTLINTVLKDFYLTQSLPQAFGKNVVNVILVDFRSLDTLVEVIVIIVALVSVKILLGNSKEEQQSE